MEPRVERSRSRCPQIRRAAARAAAGALARAVATLVLLAVGTVAAAAASAFPLSAAAQQGARPGEWPEAMQRDGHSTPWHQEVSYRIEAALDEEAEVVRGRARIGYVNHSPDTLTEFYFHQYLNAFRPNSAWARWELRFGERRFQDLGPEEHGYERFGEVRVEGVPVTPDYPFAPDSTIARLELPRALPPGDSIDLWVTWDARPSTLPRRQGRRGRHYDLAQWYPRVVVYDLEGWRAHPLYPAGEFYGEFATYDVTLEVREDQVIGATGVPVAGDPGWERAAVRGQGPVRLGRDWYRGEVPRCRYEEGRRVCGVFGPERPIPGAEDLRQPTGDWKRVRFWAEDVHHFAWSAAPDFIYEGGVYGGGPAAPDGTARGVDVHVLYRPGDEEEWGGGTALERTYVALDWMEEIWGPYAYPQVTNLHRIEPGGTEFPMVIMDGRASQSLILHEVGHIYAHGMLANNEWYEGWLDEGVASFTTSWFFEEEAGQGRSVWEGAESAVLGMEVRGETWPVVMPSEDYPDYTTYSRMIYTKGSLILRMLRDMAGEEDFRRILRTFYERHALTHVDSEAFQAVTEEVLREDMDWFFGQWLHATGLVDYALRDVDVEPLGDAGADGPSGWVSRFTVEKLGQMRMPVPVRITGPEGQVARARVDGWAARDRVAFRTDFRPVRIELDPEGTILDWNALNDGWEAGLGGLGSGGRGLGLGLPRALGAVLGGGPGVDASFLSPLRDLPSSPRTLEAGWLPFAWETGPDGWTPGLFVRTAYNDFLHRSIFVVGLPSVYYRVENPIWGDRARLGTTLEAFAGEGRVFLRGEHALGPETGRGRAGGAGAGPGGGPPGVPPRGLRVFGSVAGVYDEAYLRPGRWSPGEDVTGEAGLGWRGGFELAGREVTLDASGSAGIDTRRSRYLRGELEMTGEWSSGPWSLRPRGYLAGSIGRDPDDSSDWDGTFVPLERRFFLAGGGPYHALCSPFSRSRGALMAEEGVIPGGAGLRGFSRALPAEWVGAVNLDLFGPGLDAWGFRLRPAAFADVAVARRFIDFSEVVPGAGETLQAPPFVQVDETAGYWDAGVGLELGRAGSPIRVRLDVPFLVSDPELANASRDETVGWRLAVGFRGY